MSGATNYDEALKDVVAGAQEALTEFFSRETELKCLSCGLPRGVRILQIGHEDFGAPEQRGWRVRGWQYAEHMGWTRVSGDGKSLQGVLCAECTEGARRGGAQGARAPARAVLPARVGVPAAGPKRPGVPVLPADRGRHRDVGVARARPPWLRGQDHARGLAAGAAPASQGRGHRAVRRPLVGRGRVARHRRARRASADVGAPRPARGHDARGQGGAEAVRTWNAIGGPLTSRTRSFATDAFQWGWDKLNAERADWASNPFVFAITFKLLEERA